VALAREVLVRPHNLVLDEATVNVDQSTKEGIHRILQRCFWDNTIFCVVLRAASIAWDCVVTVAGGWSAG
jgi:ABC-type multidrug transport system fused ATPase/permease subunit